MFTGLVQFLAYVAAVEERPPGKRLVVRSSEIAQDASLGDSICVSGCCLTVVAREGDTLAFDAGPETLSRTTLGRIAAGDRVNLEPSLGIGDKLGGHFVTGHVDCVGKLDDLINDRDWSTFWFHVFPEFTKQMAAKGSVAVDGVSLTLVDVGPDRFSVALIPHTLAVTTLGRLKVGDPVNVETDLLAKYVGRIMTG